MTCSTPPKFFQPLIAAAIETIELIAYGVLLVIVLVILLCRIELSGLDDLGDDRLFEGLGLVKQFL